jgi:hypothetical protein
MFIFFIYFFYLSTLTKKKIQTDGKKKKLLEADYWASSDVVRKNL